MVRTLRGPNSRGEELFMQDNPTIPDQKKKAVPKLGYSKKEAAEASSLSVRTLDYLIECGHLRAVKIGRRVVIPSRELQRLVEGGFSK